MAVWFLLAVIGCGPDDKDEEGPPASIDADTYVAEYSVGFCSLYGECAPDELEDLYGGSVDSCASDIAAVVAERIRNPACTYDGRAAAACIEVLADLTCAQWDAGEAEATCGATISC